MVTLTIQFEELPAEGPITEVKITLGSKAEEGTGTEKDLAQALAPQFKEIIDELDIAMAALDLVKLHVETPSASCDCPHCQAEATSTSHVE
jgi:hypothetical protein